MIMMASKSRSDVVALASSAARDEIVLGFTSAPSVNCEQRSLLVHERSWAVLDAIERTRNGECCKCRTNWRRVDAKACSGRKILTPFSIRSNVTFVSRRARSELYLCRAELDLEIGKD